MSFPAFLRYNLSYDAECVANSRVERELVADVSIEDVSIESQTSYEIELPPCDADRQVVSAIFLTHFTQRNNGQSSYEPDHVTFCEWFIHGLAEDANAGAILDTKKRYISSELRR